MLVYGAANVFLLLIITIVVMGLCCRLQPSSPKHERVVEKKPVSRTDETKKEPIPEYAKVNKRKTSPNPRTGASTNTSAWPASPSSGYEDIDKISPVFAEDKTYSNNFDRVPQRLSSLGADYEDVDKRSPGKTTKTFRPGSAPSNSEGQLYIPDPIYTEARRSSSSILHRKLSDSAKSTESFRATDDFRYEDVEGRRTNPWNRKNERALSDSVANSDTRSGTLALRVGNEGRGANLQVVKTPVDRTHSDGVVERESIAMRSERGEFNPRGPIYSVVDKRKKSNVTNQTGGTADNSVTVIHLNNPRENVYSLAKM